MDRIPNRQLELIGQSKCNLKSTNEQSTTRRGSNRYHPHHCWVWANRVAVERIVRREQEVPNRRQDRRQNRRGRARRLRWFDRIMLASAAEVPDAARFEIDVSGSSVAFPANGSVTLQLFDPQQGVTIASRQFQWHRTGNILRLVDPDGANTWAAAESGPATELRYDLATFDVGAAPGPNTIAAASRYGGATKAASVSDFQVCTKYPSPYQCGLTP